MNKIKNFVNKYFDYFNFGIASIMLFLACFHNLFTIIAMCYLLVVSLFLKTEQIIKLQMLVLMFQRTAIFNNYILVHLFIFAYIKNLIINIVLKKHKVNIKIVIAIIVLSIYMIVSPIYKTQAIDFALIIMTMLTILCIYEDRKNINFVSIAKAFCYFLIIACVLGKLMPEPSLLIKNGFKNEVIDGIERYSALFTHPNLLSDYAMIAITVLLVLKYYNKIDLAEFMFLFLTIFAFGYMSLTRTFILLLAIIYSIYFVIYMKKYGIESYKFLLTNLSCVLLIVLLMQNITVSTTSRFENPQEIEGVVHVTTWFSNEDVYWKGIIEGKVYYDRGRLSLWTLYFGRIIESPRAFLFGYGISAPNIGTKHTHNIVLNFLYKFGLVGSIMVIIFIAMFIDFKELKKHFIKYLGVLYFAVSYFGIMLLNNNTLETAAIAMLISMSMFVKSNNVEKPKPVKTLLK